MFFQGVADVFKFPNKDTIKPTEEQEERFVRCVLENKPFTQTVRFGNVAVTFTTPSAEEYKIIHAAEPDVFADYLFVSNIASIQREDHVIYYKQTIGNFQERLEKLQEVFKDSIVLPLIVGYWYQFREVYNKLYEMSMSPDFFVRKKGS